MRRHAPYARIIRLMSGDKHHPSRCPGSLETMGLVVGRVGGGGGTKHTLHGSLLSYHAIILAIMDSQRGERVPGHGSGMAKSI